MAKNPFKIVYIIEDELYHLDTFIIRCMQYFVNAKQPVEFRLIGIVNKSVTEEGKVDPQKRFEEDIARIENTIKMHRERYEKIGTQSKRYFCFKRKQCFSVDITNSLYQNENRDSISKVISSIKNQNIDANTVILMDLILLKEYDIQRLSNNQLILSHEIFLDEKLGPHIIPFTNYSDTTTVQPYWLKILTTKLGPAYDPPCVYFRWDIDGTNNFSIAFCRVVYKYTPKSRSKDESEGRA